MKLPNGQFAIVDITKLSEYCLSKNHLRGRHKARVFASALSMNETDAAELRNALLSTTGSENRGGRNKCFRRIRDSIHN